MTISHPVLSRLLFTLLEGIDFLISNFDMMRGGEIFFPKIPSLNISFLASAIAPELEQTIIGFRPGEKLHEIMCPADDSHLTIEFEDYFVIKPSITFFEKDFDYSVSNDGEQGKSVEQSFEYSSGTNDVFLDVDAIKDKYNL